MVRAIELARTFRASPRRTVEDLQEALRRGAAGEPGGLRPSDFRIRDLAAAGILVGGEPIGLARLQEFCASEAILEDALDTTAFAALTRNVVNVAVLEGYTLPAFTISRAVREVQGNALFPRITGVSMPMKGERDLEVAEAEAIPTVGMGDEYARGGQTKKYGAIVPITKEVVMADETGAVLESAARVGELIGMERETILVDIVCGLVDDCVIEKRYGDPDEVTGNLFQDGDSESLGDRFVNIAELDLEDWTSIGAAEQLLASIILPGTASPVMLTRRFLLCPTQMQFTAQRILSATETRSAGATNTVVAGNPLSSLGITPISSPLVYSRQVAAGVSADDAAGTWFYGDLYRAVAWYKNWGLTVDEDRDGEVAFTNDILVRFKATIRGGSVVTEPRAWARLSPSAAG